MTERTRTAAKMVSDTAMALYVRANTYATAEPGDGLFENLTEKRIAELEDAIATFRRALTAERQAREEKP